jgi:hypothetical protein
MTNNNNNLEVTEEEEIIISEQQTPTTSSRMVIEDHQQQQQQTSSSEDDDEGEEEGKDDDPQSGEEICVVCKSTKLNRNKVCYIAAKNVHEYMKCFSGTYDGQLGRACQSCYNKFYIWRSQMRHGHKKCACCDKDIVKQSCRYLVHEATYKQLFPESNGDADSRVCQSCYYKGLKLRNGNSKKKKKNTTTIRKRSRTKPRKEDEDEEDEDDDTTMEDNLSSPDKKIRLDIPAVTIFPRQRVNVSFDIMRYSNSSPELQLPPMPQLLTHVDRVIDAQITYTDLHDLLKTAIESELPTVKFTTFEMILVLKDYILGKDAQYSIRSDQEYPFANFPIPDHSRIVVNLL